MAGKSDGGIMVEIYEGAISDGQLIAALEMHAAPQIGAIITYSVDAQFTYKYEVIAVEHIIDARQIGLDVFHRELAVRCGTMPLKNPSAC